jgi:hypothetical protein
MATLKDVKERVRSILGDQDADWATDAYLIPIINHVYDLQVLYLSDTCSPYITKLVVQPNLPTGTTDLAQFQNDVDEPLWGLFNPFRLEWKQCGQPDHYYRKAEGGPGFILPDVDLNNSQPRVSLCWTWMSFIAYLTPMPFPIDVRVYGEFQPPPLLKETDVVTVHPLLKAPLAEDSAACALRERSNAGQMQAYKLEGTAALDNVANLLVRGGQQVPVRLGKAHGGRNRLRTAWR